MKLFRPQTKYAWRTENLNFALIPNRQCRDLCTDEHKPWRCTRVSLRQFPWPQPSNIAPSQDGVGGCHLEKELMAQPVGNWSGGTLLFQFQKKWKHIKGYFVHPLSLVFLKARCTDLGGKEIIKEGNGETSFLSLATENESFKESQHRACLSK